MSEFTSTGRTRALGALRKLEKFFYRTQDKNLVEPEKYYPPLPEKVVQEWEDFKTFWWVNKEGFTAAITELLYNVRDTQPTFLRSWELLEGVKRRPPEQFAVGWRYLDYYLWVLYVSAPDDYVDAARRSKKDVGQVPEYWVDIKEPVVKAVLTDATLVAPYSFVTTEPAKATAE